MKAAGQGHGADGKFYQGHRDHGESSTTKEGHGAHGKFNYVRGRHRGHGAHGKVKQVRDGRHSDHGDDGNSMKFGLVITKAAGEGHGVDGESGLGMVTTEATELKDSTGSSTRLGIVTTRVTDSTRNTATKDGLRSRRGIWFRGGDHSGHGFHGKYGQGRHGGYQGSIKDHER